MLATLSKPIVFKNKPIRTIPVLMLTAAARRKIEDSLTIARGPAAGFNGAQIAALIAAIAAFTGWIEDDVGDLEITDLTVVAQALDRHFKTTAASLHRSGGRA